MTTRDNVLSTIASAIAALPRGRRLVAVDGVDGSGKTRFAAAMADALRPAPVVLVHLDAFLNTDDVRHGRGRTSPVGFWLDTYDYDALETNVLGPLGPGGTGVYRPRPGDGNAGWAPAPDDAVVVLEGMFLHRDGLPDWDYSVFLDVPFHETARRMALRDGTHEDPEHSSMRRYVGGQRLYFAEASPWSRASIVIDNTSPLAPRIRSAAEADLMAR